MERQDVTIHAPTAVAFGRAPIENVLHNCPLCKESFEWQAFRDHALDCIAAHQDHPAVIEAREGR